MNLEIELSDMNENELFYLELKRWHEMLTMTFKYYIPNGKPLPPQYEEAFFYLWKISESGTIEWLNKEPLTQDLPIQVDLFSSLLPKPDNTSELTDNQASAQNLEITKQTEE